MSKPHILVIEDNPADVELLRLALDELEEPYELVVLHDGAEALDFVKERRSGISDEDPCAILLDLYLPKYDGMEVLAALKREPTLREIRVVVLTSTAVSRRHEETIESLGATLRLKPRNFSEVIELATYVLELCKGPVAV
jgi:CheY-like chemotaxis protein